MLHIGCGTGEFLEHLPAVTYVGFDPNPQYIETARKQHPDRTMFNCSRVSTEKLGGMEKFDIAITMSVLHHLNDDEAIDLFRLARSTLVEGGRLATMDPCYVDGQSRAARYIISRDRGLNVRSEDGYRTLAEQVFERVNVTIRHDLLFTPPSHCILDCST